MVNVAVNGDTATVTITTGTASNSAADVQMPIKGLIDLDELITYVNRAVPEISQLAFYMGQFPRVARDGGNIPLVARTVVLSANAASDTAFRKQ